jgi:hypothetical protein
MSKKIIRERARDALSERKVRGEAVDGRGTEGGSVASRVGLDARLERTRDVEDKENATQVFWRTRTEAMLP